jgi:hypothetical protein
MLFIIKFPQLSAFRPLNMSSAFGKHKGDSVVELSVGKASRRFFMDSCCNPCVTVKFFVRETDSDTSWIVQRQRPRAHSKAKESLT